MSEFLLRLIDLQGYFLSHFSVFELVLFLSGFVLGAVINPFRYLRYFRFFSFFR